jgi:hypothetical protein
MVRVGIDVPGITAARVAVDIESPGPLVAVAGVDVKSAIGVVVNVDDSTVTGTKESRMVVGVSVAETDVSVGWAVNVSITAVFSVASTVAATSTVGPVFGFGVETVLDVGIAGSTHAPIAKATINPRMTVFFIEPSFGYD